MLHWQKNEGHGGENRKTPKAPTVLGDFQKRREENNENYGKDQ